MAQVLVTLEVQLQSLDQVLPSLLVQQVQSTGFLCFRDKELAIGLRITME